MRKLDLKDYSPSMVEQQAILDVAFAVGVITNMVIELSIKDCLKHDMLFRVEENYYRRKKLKDLCNLVLG